MTSPQKHALITILLRAHLHERRRLHKNTLSHNDFTTNASARAMTSPQKHAVFYRFYYERICTIYDVSSTNLPSHLNAQLLAALLLTFLKGNFLLSATSYTLSSVGLACRLILCRSFFSASRMSSILNSAFFRRPLERSTAAERRQRGRSDGELIAARAYTAHASPNHRERLSHLRSHRMSSLTPPCARTASGGLPRSSTGVRFWGYM